MFRPAAVSIALLASAASAVNLVSKNTCASTIELPYPNAWSTVKVSPPAESCCTTGWTKACSNTLQDAVDAAEPYTILELEPGTFCNKEWSVTHTKYRDYMHQPIVKIQQAKNLMIRGGSDNCDPKPKLLFDGNGGIQINSSLKIYLENLEIEGPALQISGEEASANHLHVTGRGAGGCGGNTQSACKRNYTCQWAEEQSYCIGKRYNYYNGQGIDVRGSKKQVYSNLWVHHCPSSGVKGDRCDWTTVQDSLIYGNSWWTTSATSGLSFSQSEGYGEINFVRNVVYANRNFMPFFLTKAMPPGGGHAGSSVYGTYMQDYIHDGQGMYTTRSQDYNGTLTMKDNIAYDNGINGISLHKTTSKKVTVVADNNQVFENGRTSVDWEHRQNAGGLVVNSGGSSIEAKITLMDNFIGANAAPDRSYQCYGTCTLNESSSGNTYCGGSPRNFNNPQFAEATDCDSVKDTYQQIRDQYPASRMPICPQWTNFTLAEGYNCTDRTVGGGTNFSLNAKAGQLLRSPKEHKMRRESREVKTSSV